VVEDNSGEGWDINSTIALSRDPSMSSLILRILVEELLQEVEVIESSRSIVRVIIGRGVAVRESNSGRLLDEEDIGKVGPRDVVVLDSSHQIWSERSNFG